MIQQEAFSVPVEMLGMPASLKEEKHIQHNRVGIIFTTGKSVKVMLTRGKSGSQASWRVYSFTPYSGIFVRKKAFCMEESLFVSDPYKEKTGDNCGWWRATN